MSKVGSTLSGALLAAALAGGLGAETAQAAVATALVPKVEKVSSQAVLEEIQAIKSGDSNAFEPGATTVSRDTQALAEVLLGWPWLGLVLS